MKIRLVHPDDLQVVTQIEAACFPAAEAAPQEELSKRIQAFPTHFWILEEKDKPIGFINGMVTDNRTICDEMFENAFLHRENGAYQSVFGLDVLPEYRCKGYAAKLMQTLIDHAKQDGRRGCILTCKEHLLHYYAKFGYKNLGVSASKHGGATWYDMLLEF
ncbi:MAG TPA: GNAT family N-acetyltransferase [Firmicutes bacterium]|nr:GNAT family N-acetyltransferase [Bacillota bacterium]